MTTPEPSGEPPAPEPDPPAPPAGDPEPDQPPARDPRPPPNWPGEPAPTIEDPPLPGEPARDPGMLTGAGSSEGLSNAGGRPFQLGIFAPPSPPRHGRVSLPRLQRAQRRRLLPRRRAELDGPDSLLSRQVFGR
jgi:hypothetical protein